MINLSDIHAAKILIVDDLVANIRLLERMLLGAGYVVVSSTLNPTEVCELHRQNKYDLILLDLQMPVMDGFEVMEKLKEIETDDYLPVIVITAQPGHKLRALQAGAKDFVSKPFDLPEVLMRVHNMLEVRLLHKELHNYNELLEEKVRERTLELRETQLEVIQRLTSAMELHDNETGMHTIRIGLYCAVIGKAMGMNVHDCELLVDAGAMHDIGTIGIPDYILLKPEKLTTEEWDTMKTHTTIGATLLSSGRSELTRMGHLIALNHHERWDGSGYPNGLIGENIPIVAQICGICDDFDALTSERSYKKAWSVEQAIENITEGVNKHFSKSLVVMFLEALPELTEIKNQYSESMLELEDFRAEN